MPSMSSYAAAFDARLKADAYRHRAMRFVKRVGGAFKTAFAIAGFGVAVGSYVEYKYLTAGSLDTDDGKKKKVLVIPFHRLRLVERRTTDWQSQIRPLVDEQDKTVTMEVREFVDLLHKAAEDPAIVALYGIFGHGSQLSNAGWADLEEVRNALRVFRESHRRHAEPNLNHEMQVIPLIESKPLYAYADTFSSLMDPANKEYYLASIFTHIHLQQQGELNLFGMLSQQFFLRQFLERNGVIFHVFKHGEYKNAPNMFTDASLSRSHRENITSIIESVNANIYKDIAAIRKKPLSTGCLNQRGPLGALWKRIYQTGTMPAVMAWNGGLIDYLPRRDPLPDLLALNQSDSGTTTGVEPWSTQETDVQRFQADTAVTLKAYAKQAAKEVKLKETRERWKRLRARFLKAGNTQKETIALLYINGGIGDETAQTAVDSIRKIRKDKNTKCVVVRVTSPGGSIFACETILQELKALETPVVFSFGNVSASGGYYIASDANRIFASAKTLTGSIGVFGIRVDLTGLAKQYGINVEHVTASDLSAMYSPFHAMTDTMKRNMSYSIDRYYAQFKSRVADGRKLSDEYVERVAQGRIWTGEQGKMNGLVDEIGGLHRAIEYARRTFTVEDAALQIWPKKKSLWEMLLDAKQQGKLACLVTSGLTSADTSHGISNLALRELASSRLIDNLLSGSAPEVAGKLCGVWLACDENAAIQCMLEGLAEESHFIDPEFYG